MEGLETGDGALEDPPDGNKGVTTRGKLPVKLGLFAHRAWRVVLDAGFLRVCPIQPHFLRRICLAWYGEG
nr:hypothetical protein BaRGS_014463 [Batillaria attramentaria]